MNRTDSQPRLGDRVSARWLEGLGADVRFALRYFKRHKATTAIVIAVLALGIGANTVIFSLLQAVTTRPAPAVPDDERLVRVWSTERATTTAKWTERDLSFAELGALAQRTAVFDAVTGFHSHDVVLHASDSADARAVKAQFVTPEFFATIGVAISGPGFTRNHADADMSAVLAATEAEKLYGSALRAIGQRVLINGVMARVVGVAPPRFQGARRSSTPTSIWIPLSARAEVARVSPAWLEGGTLEVIARLSPSATVASASAAARDVVVRALPDSATRQGMARNASVLDLEAIPPGPENFERIAMTAAASLIGLLILLVTCTNVSSLMVAAATGRRHEIAVRFSLGASRGRVVRQLLTESTILTLAGGVAALLLFWWGAEWLKRTQYVEGLDVSPDGGTLVFMLLLAGGTGIVFGLSPALHAARGRLSAVMSSSGTGATSRSRLQRGFVVAQIVFSQPLLLVLGVMLSLAIQDYRPTERDLSERLVRLTFRPLAQTGSEQQRVGAVERLAPVIASRPEVRGIGPEAGGYGLRYVTVAARTGGDSTMLLRVMGATPELFGLTDARVILGRNVELTDTNSAAAPIVIGSALARRLWGESSPLGRTLLSPRSAQASHDTLHVVVVGVYQSARGATEDDVIRAYTAHKSMWRRDALLVRTHAPAAQFLPTLRQLVRDAAPGLPVATMETQAQRDENERDIALRISMLAAAAAALALLLASLGLYGVVALAVRQRRREIGIRIAVGAAPRRVAAMFLASGVRMGVIGLILGLPLCVIGLHVALQNEVLIAPTLNPWRVGIGIAAVLLAVVALATWLPARRAASVDPASTLRVE